MRAEVIYEPTCCGVGPGVRYECLVPYDRTVGIAIPAPAQAQTPPPPPMPPIAAAAAKPPLPSDADIEQFLLNAPFVKTRSAGKGITGSFRATMTDGTRTHDAHIQTIDESKREFRATQGTELNFRDYWVFNVAGYKIDRMLGLEMVPCQVSRRWRSNVAAYTWWVDDFMMDEQIRFKNKSAAGAGARTMEPADATGTPLRSADCEHRSQPRQPGDRECLDHLGIDHTRAFRTTRR